MRLFSRKYFYTEKATIFYSLQHTSTHIHIYLYTKITYTNTTHSHIKAKLHFKVAVVYHTYQYNTQPYKGKDTFQGCSGISHIPIQHIAI